MASRPPPASLQKGSHGQFFSAQYLSQRMGQGIQADHCRHRGWNREELRALVSDLASGHD
ncbi:hypothetical protein BCON_0025g00600 [Botryotinia convoluta]|uniref:Uncharacterized protein n=1 Tax=Botryotinia convoluta TaxID=54673 RepID=A0A4Z1IQI5_9HELO|nr:hypothetical protein BCON_0025g00600 [Botryotinia convoluta]